MATVEMMVYDFEAFGKYEIKAAMSVPKVRYLLEDFDDGLMSAEELIKQLYDITSGVQAVYDMAVVPVVID